MPAKYKHGIIKNYKNNYWIIFLKCIGWILLGAAAGYAFFYFFRGFSISIVERLSFSRVYLESGIMKPECSIQE